ncbi:MATE family efflux transporter, partial [bacterium]
AAPIALQNLIASSLNMVDTVLIGGLGPTAIAAVGLANQVFFLFNLISFGICSGAAIFTAQFWGERDEVNVRRVLGFSLLANLSVAVLFLALATFLPGPILSLFTRDPQVILLGSKFLRIISPSYLLFGITFAFAFTLRGVGQPAYPMVASGVAFGVNTLLNYLLIYGHWGLPRLGVAGSATATLIAITIETMIILGFVYGLHLVPAARLRELLDLSGDFLRRVFRTILPVIGNETLWALGFSMYPMVYAHMGTEVIAAFNIYATVDRLGMVLFMGMASACAVMVGQQIGAGRETTAFTYARRFALLGPGLGIVMGALLLLGAGTILGLFNVPSTVIATARGFITIFACTIPIRIFNLTNIVGILRSGGDTRFSLFLDTAALWLVAVPLAFLAGLVWHLPPIYVYLMATVEEVVKFSLGRWRLLSGRWINNLVRGMGHGEAPAPAAVDSGS